MYAIFLISGLLFLGSCANFPSSLNESKIQSKRTVAQAAYASEEDSAIYEKLDVPEVQISRGANSMRYQKISGRVTCDRVISQDGDIVRTDCSMTECMREGYCEEDEKTYFSLNVREVQFARGANSARLHKSAGRLTCVKTTSRADNIIVGYECNL